MVTVYVRIMTNRLLLIIVDVYKNDCWLECHFCESHQLLRVHIVLTQHVVEEHSNMGCSWETHNTGM